MDWLDDFKKDAEEFNNSKYGKFTDNQITSSENGASSEKRKDSEYQREMSKRAHQSRLESGYYESETHKQAAVSGGYATQEKYPDLFADTIKQWRLENPEEYAKQRAKNAEHGRRGLDKGRETQKKQKAERTESYKQLLYDVVQESEITPLEAFEKYRNHFEFWTDSGCKQMFKRYMRSDASRWEYTGKNINRSKIYKKILK